MPTRAEWLQALRRECIVRVESSDALCDEILEVQQRRDRERRTQGRQPIARKRLTAWPPGVTTRRDLRVRPIDFLHGLGRITTPPITELIDLSSTWAELRYVWAFAPGSSWSIPRMKLSEPVRYLDFHQKTLLSDEFGVGFAAYYMASCEAASNPVDVFVARRTGQYRLVGSSRRSLPDYIFTGPNPNQYFVVECKGTQSSRAASIGQLQRGSEQVATVLMESPAIVTRLVIGSLLLQKGITLFVIDPDEEETIRPRILSKWTPEQAIRLAAVKRMTYIGDLGRAADLAQQDIALPHYASAPVRQLAKVNTERGVFVGSRQSIRTPDGHLLRMFRGMEIGVREALTDEAGVYASHPKGNFLPEEVEDDSPVVQSFSADGSLFEVHVV